MEIFMARQPILDKNMKVYAYELLYRSSLENFSKIDEADEATMSVLNNSLLLLRNNNKVSSKKYFINFTKNLIIKEMPFLFPSENIVVEILEDIVPDKDFLDVCKLLKKQNYILALDDFVLDYKYLELIKIVDIIKVDFILTSKEERMEIVKRYKKYGVQFLAEKVETKEEFEEAINFGYSYFQGFFFSKPVVMVGKDIQVIPSNVIRLLKELKLESPEYSKIAKIIERDVSLTYKLLKLVNSPIFGISNNITSIKQTLVFFGFKELKKWISIIMMRDMGNNKPNELIRKSLIRGNMAENIASLFTVNIKNECFLVGILSLIDVLTNRDMKDVLSQTPLEDDIKRALLGYQNNLGEILKIVIEYEKGNWQFIDNFCDKFNLSFEEIRDAYINAIRWSNEIMSI
ncbi:HDOD domain-containing protein [Clostridium aestuarii]|uniref:HDOD domain-containing protein n=1 Tax=Clostridium aestuarii TaxID=338193 RepID=A0ABT4CYW2_9CLOT|nr:HDOD domain-containing protein [Clostridium aestuarii]MCY6484176.1 HDOD domain-containing protein [Clostridium aestuarii]